MWVAVSRGSSLLRVESCRAGFAASLLRGGDGASCWESTVVGGVAGNSMRCRAANVRSAAFSSRLVLSAPRVPPPPLKI